MESFWKKICENKLLPLASRFGDKNQLRKLNLKINNKSKYQNESNSVDNLLKNPLIENLCLKLT